MIKFWKKLKEEDVIFIKTSLELAIDAFADYEDSKDEFYIQHLFPIALEYDCSPVSLKLELIRLFLALEKPEEYEITSFHKHLLFVILYTYYDSVFDLGDAKDSLPKCLIPFFFDFDFLHGYTILDTTIRNIKTNQEMLYFRNKYFTIIRVSFYSPNKWAFMFYHIIFIHISK